MKKFLKEHSYTIVRLVGFQLVSALLGFITASATSAMSADWAFPASSVFCIAFYLMIIAVICYEYGQKDGIRIEAGKMQKNPYKFFLLGLIANSLNFILGAVAVIGRLIISAPLSGVLADSYSPAWLASLQEICAVIARAIQSMYLGLIQTISAYNVVLLLIIPIPAVLTAGIAYLVGIRYKDGFKTGTKGTKTDRYS